MDQQVQLTGVLASNPNPNPNQVQLTGVLVSNAWLHARGEHPLPVRHWLGVSWAQRTNPTPNPDPNPNPNPSLNPNRNPNPNPNQVGAAQVARTARARRLRWHRLRL